MKKPLSFIIAILITPILSAHDYVLLPYEYALKQGQQLEVHLFVTDGFNIALERPVQTNNTLKYELISENGTTNLIGSAPDGSLPILLRKVNFKGLGLIHMTRGYAHIELANKKFKHYLKAENIENISIDESKPMQKERYTRYIKSLVQSNLKADDQLYKKQLGYQLEIVLHQNPYQLKPNDSISGQLFYQGEPLTDKVVTARNRLGSEAATSQLARTDDKGVFTFKLDRAGDWFFHTTHMIASPDLEDADWESFWTSYSFGVAGDE